METRGKSKEKSIYIPTEICDHFPHIIATVNCSLGVGEREINKMLDFLFRQG